MWTSISSLWDTIRGSLWFVPSLMALAATALAFISLWVDRHFVNASPEESLLWAYGGGADGARDVLSTVASSMITIGGVMFSITVVALTLASQQFGPRLLRHFMRDFGTQIVLGTFISVYLFCLIVLRAVRTEEAGGFVPQLSVFITMILALAGAGVLIFFFHHVTSSLRASSIIAAVAADLESAIDRLFPERVEKPGPPPDSEAVQPPLSLPDFDRRAQSIPAGHSGYVQTVDTERLIELGKGDELVIRLDCRPGDFVTCGTTIATVYPRERASDSLVTKVNRAFILGDERTVLQDLLFPAEQFAEMAVRALSPGTNDPSTALACIDRLGVGFILLAGRRVPSPFRYDDSGRLRLIAYPAQLSEMIDATFGLIRQYGRSSSAVTIRLLDTIIRVAPHVRSHDARLALFEQAAMIQRGSVHGLPEERDRRRVQERFTAAIDLLRRDQAA